MNKKAKPSHINELIALLSFFTFFAVVIFVFDLYRIDLLYLLLNMVLWCTVYSIFLLVFGRTATTFSVASTIVFLLFYADFCVYTERMTHIRFTDFLLISQALRVIDHYTLAWSTEITQKLILVIGTNVLILAVTHYEKRKDDSHKNRKAGAIFVLLASTFLIIGTISKLLPCQSGWFDLNSYTEETGLLYSWYSQWRNSKVVAPDGYDRSFAESYLSDYGEVEKSKAEDSANIIIIMNESFADYTLLGETSFANPLNFIHSDNLENFYEGKLGVSVFGGGTSNTEWEFLTGNSLALLPVDCTPFLDIITDKTSSLARELSSENYYVQALHPYYSQEYNRKAVYSFLGFDSFKAGEDIGKLTNVGNVKNITKQGLETLQFGNDLEYIRNFISDRQTYSILMDMLTLDDGQENDFMFCVTIQNHGGYSEENFVNTEYVDEDIDEKIANTKKLTETKEGSGTSHPKAVNQYLTLSAISDQAFQELIEELSTCTEKTIVLMFGDHQPALNMHDYVTYDKQLHTKLAEERYIVPYIVWSNYKLDYKFPEYISPNYLAAVIKQAANLPLTDWDTLRLNIMKDYPVITKNYVLDSNYELVQDLNNEKLTAYSYVQYQRLFDSE